MTEELAQQHTAIRAGRLSKHPVTTTLADSARGWRRAKVLSCSARQPAETYRQRATAGHRMCRCKERSCFCVFARSVRHGGASPAGSPLNAWTRDSAKPFAAHHRALATNQTALRARYLMAH
jgi:hypothetical protein